MDGESIGSILGARRDLQQRRIARFVSKNVLKRKSATLKKYGGKLKNGGPSFFLWNVWSDFFLDRWRRSGVIRMSAAAARALIALKSDNPYYVPSGSQHFEGGVVLRGIHKQNSLVDLADFAPYVPCGMRNQCLSVITHSGSSLGWCIRVSRNGFISP